MVLIYVYKCVGFISVTHLCLYFLRKYQLKNPSFFRAHFAAARSGAAGACRRRNTPIPLNLRDGFGDETGYCRHPPCFRNSSIAEGGRAVRSASAAWKGLAGAPGAPVPPSSPHRQAVRGEAQALLPTSTERTSRFLPSAVH